MAMAMGMMGGSPAGGPSGSNSNAGYAPTYFPGTANGAEAQRIPLAAGQEAQNTDFALLPSRLAKITGTVISSEGKPVEGSMINAVPRNAEPWAGAGLMMMGGTGRSDKNGNFTLSNVAPGDYTIQTRSFQITTTSGGDNMTFTARVNVGGPDGGESEVGSLPISVSGEDLSNVIIVTSKGGTAAGHLTFEGAAPPNTLTSIRISASPADADSPMMTGGGSVKPDGTFEVRGLSGTRIVRALSLPAPWTLKAVLVNGTDVTDNGIEFKGNEAVTGLEVVLTSKVTEVTGTVKGAGGQAAKDYTLVVFSDDPERWTVPNTRHVAGARPDLTGRFQVKNLPAGSYYAIAVDYLPQGEWGDPEVLERLKAKATKFTLDEGETKTLELRMQ
jgi:hypothetical protein